jgi:hypothetical protein
MFAKLGTMRKGGLDGSSKQQYDSRRSTVARLLARRRLKQNHESEVKTRSRMDVDHSSSPYMGANSDDLAAYLSHIPA